MQLTKCSTSSFQYALVFEFFNIQSNRIFNVPCHHCAGLGIKEDNFCIDSGVRCHLGIFFLGASVNIVTRALASEAQNKVTNW